MADRQEPTRRIPTPTGGQTNPRRNDVIRCERCGEDYSTTYRRCPFCDERPGRSGKRVAGNTRGGGYGGPVNPVQVAGLVISLVLIIAALSIVFVKVYPLFARGSGTPGGSSTSQSGGSSSQTGSNSGANASTSAVQGISLSRTELTLDANKSQQLIAAIAPTGTTETVSWTSSDTSVAEVDENGTVTNVNQGSEKATAVITASCGGRTATCTVTCSPGGTGQPNGGGTVSSNTRGVVTNAENGLNIRSGPGRDYDVVASASNGARVTILEDSGNGWYKVDYGNGKTGYVSSDYVSVTG